MAAAAPQRRRPLLFQGADGRSEPHLFGERAVAQPDHGHVVALPRAQVLRPGQGTARSGGRRTGAEVVRGPVRLARPREGHGYRAAAGRRDAPCPASPCGLGNRNQGTAHAPVRGQYRDGGRECDAHHIGARPHPPPRGDFGDRADRADAGGLANRVLVPRRRRGPHGHHDRRDRLHHLAPVRQLCAVAQGTRRPGQGRVGTAGRRSRDGRARNGAGTAKSAKTAARCGDRQHAAGARDVQCGRAIGGLQRALHADVRPHPRHRDARPQAARHHRLSDRKRRARRRRQRIRRQSPGEGTRRRNMEKRGGAHRRTLDRYRVPSGGRRRMGRHARGHHRAAPRRAAPPAHREIPGDRDRERADHHHGQGRARPQISAHQSGRREVFRAAALGNRRQDRTRPVPGGQRGSDREPRQAIARIEEGSVHRRASGSDARRRAPPRHCKATADRG